MAQQESSKKLSRWRRKAPNDRGDPQVTGQAQLIRFLAATCEGKKLRSRSSGNCSLFYLDDLRRNTEGTNSRAEASGLEQGFWNGKTALSA